MIVGKKMLKPDDGVVGVVGVAVGGVVGVVGVAVGGVSPASTGVLTLSMLQSPLALRACTVT